MEPSKRTRCEHDSGTSEPVLLPDGGRHDPDDSEDWKWDPSVDEDPPVEVANENVTERSTGESPGHETPDNQQSRDQSSQDPRPPLGDQSGVEQSDEAGSSDSPRVSRRALLLGGAGGVATATLAGGWFLRSRGPAGAKGVAKEFITAIGDNDWERIATLYHESARPAQAIERNNSTDDYETYLDTNGRLEIYEALNPGIETIEQVEHIPELSVDTSENVFFAPEAPGVLDAWKQIAVIVRIDSEVLALGRRDEDYVDELAGATTKEFILVGTVSENGEWFLWQTNTRI